MQSDQSWNMYTTKWNAYDSICNRQAYDHDVTPIRSLNFTAFNLSLHFTFPNASLTLKDNILEVW